MLLKIRKRKYEKNIKLKRILLFMLINIQHFQCKNLTFHESWFSWKKRWQREWIKQNSVTNELFSKHSKWNVCERKWFQRIITRTISGKENAISLRLYNPSCFFLEKIMKVYELPFLINPLISVVKAVVN